MIGGGTIGLLMVQMAKISGASTVMLSEPVEMRRKIGLEVGADAVIDPLNEDVRGKIREICGRDGADVVIERFETQFFSVQSLPAAAFLSSYIYLLLSSALPYVIISSLFFSKLP